MFTNAKRKRLVVNIKKRLQLRYVKDVKYSINAIRFCFVLFMSYLKLCAPITWLFLDRFISRLRGRSLQIETRLPSLDFPHTLGWLSIYILQKVIFNETHLTMQGTNLEIRCTSVSCYTCFPVGEAHSSTVRRTQVPGWLHILPHLVLTQNFPFWMWTLALPK